jgi:nucleotide-binding universal stress UspA family protein
MKILIAYDGSNCADAALEDLCRAGLPRVAEVLIVSVEELVPMIPPPGVLAVVAGQTPLTGSFVAEKRELASAACKRLQQDFPAWNISAEADMGSPPAILLAKAEAWQPDLIVVGSHGRSGLGRLILGSVSQKIVTEAHCSVRVARGRVCDARSPVRLLIGVDGSPGAGAAVRAVAARAWPAGSVAHVVAAVDDVVQEVFEYVDPVNHQGWSWLMDTLEAAEKTLLAAGLLVSPHIKKGDPQHILLNEAEAWEADCIFVGARSLNRWERFRLGSVSAAVTARAHCSVEVVRPIATEVTA